MMRKSGVARGLRKAAARATGSCTSTRSGRLTDARGTKSAVAGVEFGEHFERRTVNRGIWMQGCRASIRLRTRRPDGSKIIVWRVASNGKRSKGDWLGTGGGDSTAVEGAGGGGIAVRKAGVRHGRTGREVVVSGGGYWREAGGLVDRAGRMLRWIRTYALGSRGVCSGKGRQKKTSKYSHVGCASRSIHSLQQQGGARRRRKCPEGHAISANGAHPQRAAWGVEPKAGPGGQKPDSCCMKDRKIDAG